MKSVVVIGSSGQLGSDLVRSFDRSWEVIGLNHSEIEVEDVASCNRAITKHTPQVVINTAAFHKTEDCEKDIDKSFQVNCLGAYNVSKATASVGAVSVFISTNYVFGDRQKVYSESDLPKPLNVYGASKLAGETMTLVANPSSYIIRTGGLFGIHRSGKGHNFVSLMLEKAKNGDSIKVVDDQETSITYTLDLASKIAEIIKTKQSFGVYHLVNSGSCSWYEVAKKTFELSGIKPQLGAISTGKTTSKAKRPRFSSLVSARLDKVGLKDLRPWQEALSAYLEEIKHS